MAIVKATYTKSSAGAKASIRYIEHRPGRDGEKITRTLFNSDGLMGRHQAYRMIDEAEKGSYFYRFAISPDMKTEDIKRDISLREVTEQTMLSLEEQLQKQIAWVAAVHDDHAPHRHIHVIAILPERLQVQDFQAMRQTATEVALFQRKERDLARQQNAQERKEAQWER
jgi:hypothetical protein